jgi:hypothetical protein
MGNAAGQLEHLHYAYTTTHRVEAVKEEMRNVGWESFSHWYQGQVSGVPYWGITLISGEGFP